MPSLPRTADRPPTRDVIARATRRGRQALARVVDGAATQVVPDAIPGAAGAARHLAPPRDAAPPLAATTTPTARLPLSPPALRLATWAVVAATLATAVALGRRFLVPMAVAAFLAVLLAPLARRLRRLGVPAALAAALVSIGLTAAIGGAAWAAVDPVARIIAAMPATIDRAARQLEGLKLPIAGLERTADALERVTTGGDGEAPTTVVSTRPNLAHLVVDTSWGLLLGAAQVFAMLFVLLATTSAPAATGAPPTERQAALRWRLAAMYREAQSECLRFMSLLAITNAFYGACVGVALGLLGLPNPLLWGIGAMVVEFVPVLGMITYMAALAVAGLGTFATIGGTLGAMTAVFLLNFVVMNLVAPLFVGRRMSVHPVLLVIAVFFWTWTWGIAGAFLATPLVLTGRVLVRRLGWLGEAATGDADADDPQTLRDRSRALRAELVALLRRQRAAGASPAVALAPGGAARTTE